MAAHLAPPVASYGEVQIHSTTTKLLLLTHIFNVCGGITMKIVLLWLFLCCYCDHCVILSAPPLGKGLSKLTEEEKNL